MVIRFMSGLELQGDEVARARLLPRKRRSYIYMHLKAPYTQESGRR